ncbi:MFS transporter [Bdellovibrio bacteriovorus]|uniref:MFS transporter n=1 Tax=Bdellovibrio bacteriovorus TaxID=959 RepID=A0A150WU41_BDEBC|nr:MFS transporter [Bdellovibrio bacteriovorus]KYG70009.1 MFS transporter [Bdellovibrio bacteriovorus]
MSSSTQPSSHSLSKSLVLLLGLAVGVVAANLYYAQPLVGLISKALNLDPSMAGLVVTLTQVGYGFGVLMIVPLADIVENRKLILTMILLTIISLLGLAFATSLVPYFLAALATGLGASTVQVIVPYAAHLAPEATRGRVVGSLMSGLMIGIMLSRPISSLLTDLFSWHAVFYFSAALMLLLALALYKLLPERQPTNTGIRYSKLMASMGSLFAQTPVLRRRAIYQAFMFGAFSLFWTTTPLLLVEEFHLSQTAIALFALAGVAGAVSAPLAGRMADKGFSRQATTVAMISASASFLITHIFAPGSGWALAVLVFAAILLDAGITANLVLGQRAIFSLSAELRGRLNGLYVATIFVGGAVGSYVGAWAYAHGGWMLTSWVGFLFPLLAFIYFGTEWLTGFQKVSQ